MMNRRPSLGFSLVELMLAIGIGTAVLGTVWAYYNTQDRDIKVRQTAADVRTILAAANSVYANNEGYQTPSSAMVAQNATFDSVFAAAGNPKLRGAFGAGANPINFWGGTWSLNTIAATPTLVQIQLTNVPERECIGIVQSLAPDLYLAYVDTVLIAMDPAPTADSTGRSVARVPSLARACAKGALANENTIQLQFLKPFDYGSYRSQPFTTPIDPTELARLTTAYNRYQSQMTFRETALAAAP